MTITGATRVFGLLGDPVAHSLSPRLCNEAFRVLGEDAVYVAWPSDVSRPAELMAGLAALGVAGANVTYPLKTAVLPYLATRSAEVEAVGAVNVLTRQADGGYRGENTDAPGVVLALQAGLSWSPVGARAVIIGAGGAARAAAWGLLEAGAAVTMLVRDGGRAASGLPAVWRDRVVLHELGTTAAASALLDATLVVQATPVGLDDPEARPLVAPASAPSASGFELNYGRRLTAFARAWRETGRPCLTGRDLLTAQAHLALRCWLGRAPDPDTMRNTLGEESPA